MESISAKRSFDEVERASRDGGLKHKRARIGSEMEFPGVLDDSAWCHEMLTPRSLSDHSIYEEKPLFLGGDGIGFSGQHVFNNAFSGANVQNITTEPQPVALTPYEKAMKAWSRFKFVRNRTFSAHEASEYIRYFYNHLLPLTFVSIPDFHDYQSHERLLTEEPVLAVTILLIASRYMPLQGPGNDYRQYAIHDKLWSYMSRTINRIIWGEDRGCGDWANGGGCKAQKGLRTIGTVESLILLTEWQARDMALDDKEDGDLMADVRPLSYAGKTSKDSQTLDDSREQLESWLEACWRSDRISWMVLGLSTSLAVEKEVFELNESSENGRRLRLLRNSLLILNIQTSGRLRLTSMLPESFANPEDSDIWQRGSASQLNEEDTILAFWLRIGAALRQANLRIFPNKRFTRNLIASGRYKTEARKFQRPLQQLLNDVQDCTSLTETMRSLLKIEIEYTRAYTNSLALQAVLERQGRAQEQSAIAGEDAKLILALKTSASNVLETAISSLGAQNQLRHAPVRTFSRISSVAVLLLKTLGLHSSHEEMSGLSGLIDQTIYTLRSCTVDDAHLASQFANLLDNMNEKVRQRLGRMAADTVDLAQPVHDAPQDGASNDQVPTDQIAEDQTIFELIEQNHFAQYTDQISDLRDEAVSPKSQQQDWFALPLNPPSSLL